ncbi:MAG: diaminopimelate decarboxylase family protein [Acidimicrobiales bacterium]
MASESVASGSGAGDMPFTGGGPAPIARHLLPDSATVDASGMLRVGGVSIDELASAFGTPLFVYDEEHLRGRCREARQAWGDGVAYASKAFLCKAMARLVHQEGLRLDVSSEGEMHVAIRAGVPPSSLVLHGNNKSDAEIASACSYGVGRIVVDSFDELDRIGRIVPEINAPGKLPQAVMVRINPGIEAHTHEYVKTGQADSKFGFSFDGGDAMEVLRRVIQMKGVELAGLHAHIGSQIFDVEHFEEEVKLLVELSGELAGEIGGPPGPHASGGLSGSSSGSWPPDSEGLFAAKVALNDGRLGSDGPGEFELCIGGGLGVAYLSSESAPTITGWAKAVMEVARKSGADPRLRITAEPGRSIVATAGMTIYTVGTIKDIAGIRAYLSVDGGMSDNPRPVLYGSGYEAFLARETGAWRPRRMRIVGKHCESGDVVVADAMLPEDVSVGDLLVTPVTGAYGYSMASNYNKVPRPAVVFVSSGDARVVVKRESLDDMYRLDGD